MACSTNGFQSGRNEWSPHAPAQVTRRGHQGRVVEIVPVVFLLVAHCAGVLGPQLRGVDSDVFCPEESLGEGDELVMNDDPAQGHGREGKADDPAELIAGVDPVTPLARGSVVLLGAGVHGRKITLSRFQLGTVEVARQHDKSITPPCGCGVRQVHRGILFHPQDQPRTLLAADTERCLDLHDVGRVTSNEGSQSVRRFWLRDEGPTEGARARETPEARGGKAQAPQTLAVPS